LLHNYGVLFSKKKFKEGDGIEFWLISLIYWNLRLQLYFLGRLSMNI
jgi:hypothetical protein